MASRPGTAAFQFKVTLKGIRPPIWRRILVPAEYSLWDLHVAMQDAMGWFDCHLHAFRMPHPGGWGQLEIGIPGEFMEDVLPEWEVPIAAYFTPETPRAVYEYDFGDGWEHDVRPEKILEKYDRGPLPACIAGRRACPPEDCGGVWGYQDLLEALENPSDEEARELAEWAGDYDPEALDPKGVIFTDPRRALKARLGLSPRRRRRS